MDENFFDTRGRREFMMKMGILALPPVVLGDVAALVKKNLGIGQVKYIGDLSTMCGRILLMPGASGGQRQIGAIRQYQPDLVICGS
jgi:hypothetical protein